MTDKAHIMTDREIERMERHLSVIYRRAEEEIGKSWKAYLAEMKEQGDKLLQAVEDAKGKKAKLKAQKTYQEFMMRKTMMNAHYRDLAETVAQEILHINETATAYINGRLPRVYAMNYNQIGQTISESGVGYTFSLVDASTIKRLATTNKTLLPYKWVDGRKDVRWNTKKLNSEVMQGIIQGESIPKIAKRLERVMDMNATSAIRNARTTTTSAENKGRMDSFHRAEEMGIQIKKVWIAANDARTREAHAELDGEEADIDEPFVNSIGEIMFPGDPDADPANVYNCRCTLGTRIVGFGGKNDRR